MKRLAYFLCTVAILSQVACAENSAPEMKAEVVDYKGQYYVRFLKPKNIWLFYLSPEDEILVYDVEFLKDGKWQKPQYVETLGCDVGSERIGPEHYGPPALSNSWVEDDGYHYLFDLEGWDTGEHPVRLKFHFDTDHSLTKPVTVYSKSFVLRHWIEMDYLRSIKAEQEAANKRR